MVETQPEMVTAYHLVDGPSRMSRIDAINAARDFPREWSLTPWTVEARTAAAAMKSQEAEALSAVNLATNWREFSPETQRALAIKFGAPQSTPPDEIGGFLADLPTTQGQ